MLNLDLVEGRAPRTQGVEDTTLSCRLDAYVQRIGGMAQFFRPSSAMCTSPRPTLLMSSKGTWGLNSACAA